MRMRRAIACSSLMPATSSATRGRKSFRRSDAVLQGAAVFGGKLFAQYEQNASSQLKVFDLEGKKLSDIVLPAIGTVFGSGGKWNRDEAFLRIPVVYGAAQYLSGRSETRA